jgi:outer membrane protein
MKIRLAIPALAVVLFVPVLGSQSSSAQTPVKIGVINVQAAITNTAEGKQAAAELQSQFAPRQSELQNLQKQIEDLQTRMRTTANTLSDEEKTRLARQYDQLTRTLQRKNQDYTDDSNEAQQEVVSTIGRKLMDVLDKYSKENGYTAILDMSSQQTSVLSWSPQIDITQDIVRLYDQAYPIKAAATPSKPAASAAPKPATPKPQQPPQPKP